MKRSDGRLPSVTALRAFSVAGRHSSLAAAAVELAVSPGAVSRQIIALGSAIGLRLFLRQSGGISLTEQGRVYHDRIAAAFDDMLAATRDLFAPADTNRVMISVLPTFAMRWLVPRLPRFSRLHPALELEVITGDGAPEPNGPWNLAIRYGSDIWPGLEATRLLNEEMIVVLRAIFGSIVDYSGQHPGERAAQAPHAAKGVGAALPPSGSRTSFTYRQAELRPSVHVGGSREARPGLRSRPSL